MDRRTIPISCALLVLACGTPPEPAGEGGEGPALGGGTAPPIRTDRTEYELRSTEHGLEVEIPFTYTNGTGRTVYLVNCNGIVAPSLEKRVDGEWVHAWAAIVPQCLSPPIVIEPGARYSATLAVFAGHLGNEHYPKFEVEPVEGTYRLVLHHAVHEYEDRWPDFGDPLPLEHRVSNRFSLVQK